MMHLAFVATMPRAVVRLPAPGHGKTLMPPCVQDGEIARYSRGGSPCPAKPLRRGASPTGASRASQAETPSPSPATAASGVAPIAADRPGVTP
jgi:hypothetical protein